jgi:hypothetical protein
VSRPPTRWQWDKLASAKSALELTRSEQPQISALVTKLY